VGLNRVDNHDIKVSPAQRAYLAAFDHWLKTAWARGKTGTRADGATDLKNEMFDEMCAEAVDRFA
jgi:hypothetical protein